jgi:dihydroflavonol-4-reductase
MRVAVTGGTGFVGAHSVRALVDAGHEVRVLVHPSDSVDVALIPLGVQLADADVVVGDVCDPAAVDRLLDGCDALLHGAGVVGVDDSREQLMWDVNVHATAMVLTRAVAAGLDPIVHVASYAALYPSPTGVIGPDTPTASGRSAYGRTKSAADRIARGFQAAGAPVVVTYPSSVVGPAAGERRGVSADGWAPLLRFGVSVSFDGGMTMIDVRDVADVHAAVISAGPGLGPRRYVCGGEMMAFDRIIDVLADASGRRIRRIRISPRVMRAIGRVADGTAKALSFPPVLSSEAAILLTRPQPTDDSATLSELGLRWRPVRAAVAESVFAPET